jgi:two-component system, cell cycle sensor histidine kinase and response regulator CckA
LEQAESGGKTEDEPGNENERLVSDSKKSEERSKTLFESSLDAIIVTDGEGKILDWNARAELVFGWAARQAIGRTVAETILPPRLRVDGSSAIEAFLRTADSSAVSEPIETRALTREGTEIPIEVTISSLRVTENRIVFLLARDASGRHRGEQERHRLEAQLLVAQRMESVGLLSSGVAHDFNNILTVISGQCDLLLGKAKLEDRSRHRVEEIDRAAERARALIRQLLAFGRRQVLQPTILDLNGVLADLKTMLARILGEDVLIDTELAPDLGRVKADRGQIEQVIMNLAVNARDAMPKGGRLTFRTANLEVDEARARRSDGLAPGSYISMKVTDRGAGIDPEVLAHIFEPFYTTKELGRGTGLGLSTVYGIVKQSEGCIEVESAPGDGSSFEVLLPRVSGPAPVLREEIVDPAPIRGEGTILLVEDDGPVRGLAREILEYSGYQVLESEGGREALSRIERERGEVDLVLTDLVMPGMSGDEFADLLAARYPRVRVLYTSGHFDRPIRVPLVRGYRELIQKPFNAGDLARRVGELVRSRK